ncbi:hypothetical protein I3842_05G154600 [Carya illinoinensis]|uniref:Uncharacterized protein n=1 Tax=Carya illinoinensis TaxID=32201 RepID=A0A922JQS7_CARIL|nr:hypothetical protein I3842_05G154600 [Carya illinoinensis]
MWTAMCVKAKEPNLQGTDERHDEIVASTLGRRPTHAENQQALEHQGASHLTLSRGWDAGVGVQDPANHSWEKQCTEEDIFFFLLLGSRFQTLVWRPILFFIFFWEVYSKMEMEHLDSNTLG